MRPLIASLVVVALLHGCTDQPRPRGADARSRPPEAGGAPPDSDGLPGDGARPVADRGGDVLDSQPPATDRGGPLADQRGDTADAGGYACSATLAPGGDVQSFVNSLTAGQTGCLRGGDFSAGDVAFQQPGITLASYPGERATINLTYAHIDAGATQVTLRRLNLSTTGQHTIRIFADGAVLEGNDITNHNANGAGACVGVGGSNGKPDGVVLRGNKLHDCGGNATNLNHGIYANAYTNLTIVDNLFWRNGGYSIQLYPDAHGTIVRHNVIDGSQEYSVRGGLVIDGDSDDHLIEHNVFSHTATTAIVARTGSGHAANHNCFWSNSGGDLSGTISQTGNVSADPQYVDRPGRDYRLSAGSGCLAAVLYDTAAKVAASW